MEEALYGRRGFFSGGRGAGRNRDFITSPELGPLFAAVMARALDGWWDELGRPDPFTVVEFGAGSGALARDILLAGPRCRTALRYETVEYDSPPPNGSFTGVVLANELLDNLPFDLFEHSNGEWFEVRVDREAGTELLVPAGDVDAHWLAEVVPTPPTDGSRVPRQRRSQQWLRAALDLLKPGRVVVVDYMAKTADLAERPWSDWLRTYRSHGRGSHPLDQPGSQDITADVAVDQLAQVAPPDVDRTQAQFLRAHGIDELVTEARAAWQAAAARPDVAALKARSRIGEAAALLDPGGLGGFRVLEWVVGEPG